MTGTLSIMNHVMIYDYQFCGKSYLRGDGPGAWPATAARRRTIQKTRAWRPDRFRRGRYSRAFHCRARIHGASGRHTLPVWLLTLQRENGNLLAAIVPVAQRIEHWSTEPGVGSSNLFRHAQTQYTASDQPVGWFFVSSADGPISTQGGATLDTAVLDPVTLVPGTRLEGIIQRFHTFPHETAIMTQQWRKSGIMRQISQLKRIV